MAALKIIGSAFRILVIVIGISFFMLPVFAASNFAFEDGQGGYTVTPIRSAAGNQELMQSLLLTMQIAFGTVLLTLLLLIPTVAYLHLVIPGARAWVEFLTLTPLVIPPIVQAVGFLYSMPTWLKSTPNSLTFAYVILALPFSYRALDAAFATIDVRTLYDASRSLGASFSAAIRKVLIPNVATGIYGAIFLTIALVLGEFAYASLLLWDTFPTELAVAGMANASTAVALSVLSLLGVWLILIGINLFNRKSKTTVVAGAK
jgi:putative spermidine/putrescine transport system permease protein